MSNPVVGDGDPRPAESMHQDDFGSLAALFGRHHAGLVRLGLLIVGDQQAAEDVVQDVFVRLHASADRIWDEDGLAYARAAVLNGCRSELRRRAVVRRLPSRSGKLIEETAQSAEQEMLRSEDRKLVIAALASLPLRRREVLVLRYYVGLSEAEISKVLGISPGTVKSTAARGLAALSRKLGEQA